MEKPRPTGSESFYRTLKILNTLGEVGGVMTTNITYRDIAIVFFKDKFLI